MSPFYLLDTNIVSAYLNIQIDVSKKADAGEQLRTRMQRVATPCFSALTKWEIERGLTHARLRGRESNERHRNRSLAFRTLCLHSRVVPVDDRVLTAASSVWAQAKRSGISPGDVDCLLVATAVVWEYTLVSADTNLLACARAQKPTLGFENWLSAKEGGTDLSA